MQEKNINFSREMKGSDHGSRKSAISIPPSTKARLLISKANVRANDSKISDKNLKIPINLTEESYNRLRKELRYSKIIQMLETFRYFPPDLSLLGKGGSALNRNVSFLIREYENV